MHEIPAATTPEIAPEQPKKALSSDLECFCVKWLREKMGVPIKGDADTLIPNTPLGDITIGTVVLFDYGNISHAAIIIGLHRDEMTVHESNWRHCRETVRTLKLTDPSVMGFYKPAL